MAARQREQGEMRPKKRQKTGVLRSSSPAMLRLLSDLKVMEEDPPEVGRLRFSCSRARANTPRELLRRVRGPATSAAP